MDRRSTVSPFGALLDDIREERVNRPTLGACEPSKRTAVPRPARPELDLRLEAGVVSGLRAAKEGPSRRWGTSVALHGAVLLAVATLPVLMSDDLPTPSSLSKVFFVQPAVAPPPPPPAARAAAVPSVKRTTPSPRPQTLAAPVETPPALEPEELVDPPLPSLEPGNVEEGVPGGVDEGVPGGIVGGVLERTAVVEPPPASHVRVGGAVKEPRKVKNIEPVYPDVAARGRIEGVVILELAIKPNGRVEDVRVLRSIPILDAAAVDAARQWVFTPTLIRGVPVGVTMTVSVRFSLGNV